MIPLELFVTPYTSPRDMPSKGEGYAALTALGKDMSARAERERDRSEDKRRFDAEHERRLASDKSTAAYHEDLIDARREASREAARGKREARAASLMAEMRKAAAANRWDDVEAIRQQLTSLGYASEESDTALEPEEAAQAVAEDVAPAAPTPKVPAPKPAPKPNPGFSSALAGFMASEAAAPKDEDPFGLSGPGKENIEAADPTGSPLPWEALGERPPPPAEKKKRGGRYTIKDPEGFTVSTMDVPMERERKRGAIEEALQPYIDDPQNPEQQAAARRASAIAQKAIDSGYSDHAALQLGVQQMNKEMQRYKTQRLPSAPAPTGGGGGALGVSKQEQGRLQNVEAYTLKVLSETRQEEVVGKARTQLSEAEHMEKLIGSGDAFENRAALMNWLHTQIGSQQTEPEIENALGGAGGFARLEMRLNNWTDGGRMPQEIRDGLARVAQASKHAANRRLEDAGNKVYEFIRDNPSVLTPEEREKAGNAGRNMVLGRNRPSGEGGGASKATGRARAEAWLAGKR